MLVGETGYEMLSGVCLDESEQGELAIAIGELRLPQLVSVLEKQTAMEYTSRTL